MSKIGKLPIKLPEGVKVEIDGQVLRVIGPKGSLERRLPEEVGLEKSEDNLRVLLKEQTKRGKSIYGTTRTIISNMVKGVSEGWSKTLELVGTGYRGEVSGTKLILNVGFSHPVIIEAPEGISFAVEKNDIIIEGADKEQVGQIAAKIRSIRPPEPYKGKGIKYKDEVVRRKPGKAVKAVGGTA